MFAISVKLEVSVRYSSCMTVLDQLNALSCWDYRITLFDGWRLHLIGGASLDYSNAHTVEIEFHGVTYIACPTDFSHAKFRLGTGAEKQMLNRTVSLESEDIVFVIEAETTGSIEPHCFFIVAEDVVVKQRGIGTDFAS